MVRAAQRCQRAAARVARRAGCAHLVRASGLAIFAGAAAGVVLIGLGKGLGWSVDPVLGLGLPISLAMLTGGVWSWRVRLSRVEAAQRIDQSHDLHDRVSNAMLLDPERSAFAAWAHEDGEAAAGQARASKAAPIRFGWPWPAGLATCGAALALSLWVPEATWGNSTPRVDPHEVASAREIVSQIAHTLGPGEQASPLAPIATEEDRRRLEEIERELARGGLAPDEARARAAEVARDLAQRAAAEADEIERGQQSLADAMREAQPGPEADADVRRLAQALADRDWAGAEEASEAIDERLRGASPEERARLAESLERLADSIPARAEEPSADSGRGREMPPAGGEPALDGAPDEGEAPASPQGQRGSEPVSERTGPESAEQPESAGESGKPPANADGSQERPPPDDPAGGERARGEGPPKPSPEGGQPERGESEGEPRQGDQPEGGGSPGAESQREPSGGGQPGKDPSGQQGGDQPQQGSPSQQPGQSRQQPSRDELAREFRERGMSDEQAQQAAEREIDARREAQGREDAARQAERLREAVRDAAERAREGEGARQAGGPPPEGNGSEPRNPTSEGTPPQGAEPDPGRGAKPPEQGSNDRPEGKPPADGSPRPEGGGQSEGEGQKGEPKQGDGADKPPEQGRPAPGGQQGERRSPGEGGEVGEPPPSEGSEAEGAGESPHGERTADGGGRAPSRLREEVRRLREQDARAQERREQQRLAEDAAQELLGEESPGSVSRGPPSGLPSGERGGRPLGPVQGSSIEDVESRATGPEVRPDDPGAPRGRERVLAEWESDRPGERRGSESSRLIEGVRQAAQGAERAIEQRSVPSRYNDLLRRVYQRLEKRSAGPEE